MKILVFIIFIGIASVVFYLFLRKLFEDRIDKASDSSGGEKTKLPLLREEIKQAQNQGKDSELGDTMAKEAEDTGQTSSEETACQYQDMEENQD